MSQANPAADRVQNTRWKRGVFRMAVRVWVYTAVTVMLALVLAPLLITENHVSRVFFNVLLLGGVFVLAYADAATRGQKEFAQSRLLAGRMAAGHPVSGEDIARCYHPMRGVLAAIIAALPLLALTIPLAVLAKPYAYTLQDLPSWVSGLGRADINDALAYYAAQAPMTLESGLRMAVRVINMPVAYLFGGFGDAAALLQDRLGPLFVLLLPAAFALGYLRGPALDAKVQKQNEEAKRLHAKKIARKKKRERQRAQGTKGPKGPEQLV
jgi:hypothetical protein